MRRKRKAIVLTLVALCAAGCAQSDYRLSRDGKPVWHPVPAEPWRAPAPGDFEAEPPKILPETHFAAARLFESRGLLDKAILQYKRAIAVNHQYAEAYHRLGVLLSMTGQRSEALGTLRRAVELQPDHAILRNDLGFELVLNRRWTEAEVELVRAIALKPDFARAYVNLGIVQSKLGRFNEALASFLAALPEADAYYNLGLMYRGQRRYLEAEEAFRHVLAVSPDFTAAETQLEQISLCMEAETPPEPVPTGTVAKGDRRKERIGQEDSIGTVDAHDRITQDDLGQQTASAREQQSRTETQWIVESIRGPIDTPTEPDRDDRRASAETGDQTAQVRVTSALTSTVGRTEQESPLDRRPDSDEPAPPEQAQEQEPDQISPDDGTAKIAEAPAPTTMDDETATDSLVDDTISTINALHAIDPRTDLDTLISIMDNEFDCLEEGRTLTFGTSSIALTWDRTTSEEDAAMDLVAEESIDTIGPSMDEEEPCVEVLIVYGQVPSELAEERGETPANAGADVKSAGVETYELEDQIRTEAAVETVGHIVESAKADEPISLTDDTPVPLADDAGEVVMTMLEPVVDEPDEVIACVDTLALLRQLEDRLMIVRNDISCLEELDEASTTRRAIAAGPMETDVVAGVPLIVDVQDDQLVGPPVPVEPARPRDFVTLPITKARLVSEVVKDEAAETPTRQLRIDSGSKARDTTEKRRSEDHDESAAGEGKATKEPNGPPVSWHRPFEKVDELRAIVLNEINCWNELADQQVDLQPPAPLAETFDYSFALPFTSFEIGAELYPHQSLITAVEWATNTPIFSDVDEEPAVPPITPYEDIRGAHGHHISPPRD